MDYLYFKGEVRTRKHWRMKVRGGNIASYLATLGIRLRRRGLSVLRAGSAPLASLMGSLATRNYLLACVESLPGVCPPLLLLRQGAAGGCFLGDIGKCGTDTRSGGVLRCTFIGLVYLSFRSEGSRPSTRNILEYSPPVLKHARPYAKPPTIESIKIPWPEKFLQCPFLH